MAKNESGFGKAWSYAAFLVVGLVVAYAFLGVQFSSQLAGKEAELSSLRQQYGGLQGELEQARSPPFQQVIDSFSPKDAEIERLTQELAVEKKISSQCDGEKTSLFASLSACQAGAATPTPSPSASRPDFTGKDIVLAKGESFSGQDGFVLKYVGFQPAEGNKAVFNLKGVVYTRNVGDFVYFTHTAGVEYVLSAKSADENSATFYALARGKS